jgi:T4 RnlA family RNA ligase
MVSYSILFRNLMFLCERENSPFYFKDHELEGTVYRIFNYRMASYSDFLLPSALECRGTMFELEKVSDGRLICSRLTCLPPQKFFNLNENPFTMGLNPSYAVEFMEKADGSLISTYMHRDVLKLKTKASLTAEQIQLAESVLNKSDNETFAQELHKLTEVGYTVNMEIVSPLNRVVLAYDQTELKVLNLRLGGTQSTLYYDDMSGYPNVQARWVTREEILPADREHFINSIPNMVDIEGFVVRYAEPARVNQLVKIKTDWYKTLHHTKDSVTIPRRLFECVVNETVDDLRTLFADDPISLQTITDMENVVIPKMNNMIRTVENFYDANKNLSRKDYAIKGTRELKEYFGLAMTLYLKEKGLKEDGPDFKAYAIKNYKAFGIPDAETAEND